jgi:hypothetical protein
MVVHRDEFTLTMAQVYAGQGHWKKAVEIYRHLVMEQPEREDLRQALKDAEEALVAQGRSQLDELAPLLQTWLKLQIRCHQMKRLQQLKK